MKKPLEKIVFHDLINGWKRQPDPKQGDCILVFANGDPPPVVLTYIARKKAYCQLIKGKYEPYLGSIDWWAYIG